MGMGASVLPLLMKLKRQGHIANGSAVIEIGAQQLDESFIAATENIAATGCFFGVTSPPPSFTRTGTRSETNVLAGAPLSREFWTWLGLNYASIDIDGSPGSIPLDLNYDEVPAELVGRYDIVTNFGTTEHVANQLQSFKIIHDLATAGAIMLHVLPASGTPNHGLVSYNPKFFWMLGRSNGYKIAFMTMGQSDRDAGLPDDLVEFLALYEPQAKSEFAAYTMPVTSIVVALQKVFDTPFVAPLDMPTGTTTEHLSLRERYWSVLKPFRFKRANASCMHGSGRSTTANRLWPRGKPKSSDASVTSTNANSIWRRTNGPRICSLRRSGPCTNFAAGCTPGRRDGWLPPSAKCSVPRARNPTARDPAEPDRRRRRAAIHILGAIE